MGASLTRGRHHREFGATNIRGGFYFWEGGCKTKRVGCVCVGGGGGGGEEGLREKKEGKQDGSGGGGTFGGWLGPAQTACPTGAHVGLAWAGMG